MDLCMTEGSQKTLLALSSPVFMGLLSVVSVQIVRLVHFQIVRTAGLREREIRTERVDINGKEVTSPLLGLGLKFLKRVEKSMKI
jgi:hypothetical protein